MNLNKLKFVFIFFYILPSSIFADLSFSNFDINQSGDILFSIDSKTKYEDSFSTLFLKRKNSNSMEQITFFPERMECINNGTTLKIINRFGILNIDVKTGKSTENRMFSFFDMPEYAYNKMLLELQTSPNGRWISIIEPVSDVFGSLILYDNQNNKRLIIHNKVPKNSKPILWSPNSDGFIYELNNKLYFARPSWFSSKKINNNPCLLGEGKISSVQWIDNHTFVFISKMHIYKINASELLTQVLYHNILEIGTIMGNLPFTFNFYDDKIFISKSGKSLVIIKNKRNLYFLSNINNNIQHIPYLLLPETVAKVAVFWTKEKPFISAEGLKSGNIFIHNWEVKDNNFKKLKFSNGEKILISNEFGYSLPIKTKNALEIYNTKLQKRTISIHLPDIISLCWSNEDILYLGTRYGIFKLNLKTNSIQTILISEIKEFSWNKSGRFVLGRTDLYNKHKILQYLTNKMWTRTTKYTNIEPQQHNNQSERLYIDSGFDFFKNMIFIRSFDTVSNKSLFRRKTKIPNTKLLDKKNILSDKIFSHGDRNKNKIAIIFDVLTNTTGCSKSLYILNKYNIKATFFLNGSAIKNNPNMINEIIQSGHQCGSMFFSNANLSNSKYTITDEFIKNGLALNEDIFFNATKQELSLIWHTPFYILSPTIISASKKIGYEFIVPDIQIPDWVTYNEKNSIPDLYKTSFQMIEDIVTLCENGSIIPIRLGKSENIRQDYLYDSLELLIQILYEKGFEITSIAELMNQ